MTVESGSKAPADWAWRAAFAAVALSLAACGGGGGGTASPSPAPSPAPAPGPTPSPTPTPPPAGVTVDVSRALGDIYTNGFAVKTVSATRRDGVSVVTQKISITPLPDAVFNGVLRKAVTKTVETTADGLTQRDTRIVYFDANPFMLHGGATPAGQAYTVTNPNAALPTNAAPGSTAQPFFSSATYLDSTRATVVATAQVTWSLTDAGSGNGNQYFCLDTLATDTQTLARASGSECYLLDSAGQFLNVRTKLTYTDSNGVAEVLDLR